MSPLEATLWTLFGAGAMLLVVILRWWQPAHRARGIPSSPPVQLPALPPRDLQAALCVGDDHPVWRAFMQSIDSQRAQCDEAALDVDRAGTHQASYYAGGTAHLDELKRFLLVQRELAREAARQ